MNNNCNGASFLCVCVCEGRWGGGGGGGGSGGRGMEYILAHFCLESHKMDIGKQCRPRSDAAENGI